MSFKRLLSEGIQSFRVRGINPHSIAIKPYKPWTSQAMSLDRALGVAKDRAKKYNIPYQLHVTHHMLGNAIEKKATHTVHPDGSIDKHVRMVEETETYVVVESK